MRRFTKVCLIIVLVLGIAGGVFFVTGVAMGASWRAVRETAENWVWRDGEWIWHDGDWDWDWDWSDSDEDGDKWDLSDINSIKARLTETPYKEWEYSASQIQELEVEAKRAYVKVKENTKDDKIRVKVYSSRDKVEFDADDACLSVERDTKKHSVEKSPIQIEIPAGKQFSEASVYVGAGVLEIDNIEAAELSLGVGGGEFIASGKIKGSSTVLDCGMGNMEIAYLDSEYTVINCGMGSVTASLTGDREQYSASLDCGIGSVSLGDETHSGISSLTTGPTNAPRNLEIECGMGSVDIIFDAK